MASKRHIRRKACGDKTRYPDQKTAENAVLGVLNSGFANPHRQPLIPYRCEFCHHFHIGHKYIAKD